MTENLSHSTSESPLPVLPAMVDVWQESMRWQPTVEQQLKFQRLYEQVLEGNRQLNLTRITEPLEFWEKHLWDSLRGIKWLSRAAVDKGTEWISKAQINGFERMQGSAEEIIHAGKPIQASGSGSHDLNFILQSSISAPIQAIDIGTGAGFPGVPIAITQPTWNVTLLDSTRKKILFLKQLLDDLELPNCVTLIDRVEHIGQCSNYRETYDVALVRAVAAAPACAEYAMPLLKLGGLAVLYRGQWTDAENIALQSVVQLLGGKLEAVEAFKTPLTGGDRHCLYLRKVSPTPSEYPRETGLPVRNPLQPVINLA